MDDSVRTRRSCICALISVFMVRRSPDIQEQRAALKVCRVGSEACAYETEVRGYETEIRYGTEVRAVLAIGRWISTNIGLHNKRAAIT